MADRKNAVPDIIEKGDNRRVRGNRSVVIDGIKFHSKREAVRYEVLKLQRDAGLVKFFLRHVPFDLPGNTQYLLDFMVFLNDGRVIFEDLKGEKAQMHAIERRKVESIYKIRITGP